MPDIGTSKNLQFVHGEYFYVCIHFSNVGNYVESCNGNTFMKVMNVNKSFGLDKKSCEKPIFHKRI